jgi:hypothetical protein
MKTVGAFLFAFVITGCASPYQPERFGGGFSETQLDTNVFRVSFRGNGLTSTDRAEELALLRSAEIALNNGFTHFVIVGNETHETIGSFSTPTQSYTTANVTAYNNSAVGMAQTTTYGGQTFVYAKPRTTNTIVCFKGKPEIQGLVYDAGFLCNSIGQKYGVRCNGPVQEKLYGKATYEEAK